MSTPYLHRLLVVVPAAHVAALDAWIRTNIDASGGDWFVARLSATGLAPATHAWASFAATDVDARAFLGRVCNQASLTPPANWDNSTRSQKLQWVLDNRAAIRAAIGVWIVPMNNDGDWESPDDALTAMGLQRLPLEA